MLFSPVSFLAGVASWSFAEYALHNWYGHVPKGRNQFSRDHLAHHTDNRQFAPTRHKVAMGLKVAAVMAPASTVLMGPRRGMSFTLGFFASYVGYELAHRRSHTHPPRHRYGRWLRKHHFHHHFASPRANHGVTSAIWDRVFGTYEEPGQVRVPRKQAMDWLIDPETGDVAAEYRNDYKLV